MVKWIFYLLLVLSISSNNNKTFVYCWKIQSKPTNKLKLSPASIVTIGGTIAWSVVSSHHPEVVFALPSHTSIEGLGSSFLGLETDHSSFNLAQAIATTSKSIYTIESEITVKSVVTSIIDELANLLEAVKDIFDAVKDAYTVNNFSSFLAITGAEAVAGVGAGLLSRLLANILQDEKKDTVVTEFGSTGVFFGTRSLFRTITLLMGVPLPISRVIGSVTASILSESTRILGRRFSTSSDDKERTVREDTTTEGSISSSMVNATELSGEGSAAFSNLEIASDIVKWLVYDQLENMIVAPKDPIRRGLTYFAMGGASSAVAFLVKGNNKQSMNPNETLPKDILEGGILFLTYQLLQDYFLNREELNIELPFYKVLDIVESEIQSGMKEIGYDIESEL